jgi:hypothetical protein
MKHEPSPTGLRRSSRPVNAEVSRFSCMQFLSVLGVFDYVGPVTCSRFAQLAVLPSLYVYKVGADACHSLQVNARTHRTVAKPVSDSPAYYCRSNGYTSSSGA